MEKKDKMIRIRVSETEYDFLKKKADSENVTVSDLMRNSVDLMPTGEQSTEEKAECYSVIKTSDIMSMLWAAKLIVNEFDIEHFTEEVKKGNIDKDEIKEYISNVNNIRNNGKFEILKKKTLISVLHDLSQNDEMYKMDKETEQILKKILIEYLKK